MNEKYVLTIPLCTLQVAVLQCSCLLLRTRTMHTDPHSIPLQKSELLLYLFYEHLKLSFTRTNCTQLMYWIPNKLSPIRPEAWWVSGRASRALMTELCAVWRKSVYLGTIECVEVHSEVCVQPEQKTNLPLLCSLWNRHTAVVCEPLQVSPHQSWGIWLSSETTKRVCVDFHLKRLMEGEKFDSSRQVEINKISDRKWMNW